MLKHTKHMQPLRKKHCKDWRIARLRIAFEVFKSIRIACRKIATRAAGCGELYIHLPTAQLWTAARKLLSLRIYAYNIP